MGLCNTQKTSVDSIVYHLVCALKHGKIYIIQRIAPLTQLHSVFRNVQRQSCETLDCGLSQDICTKRGQYYYTARISGTK